MKKWSISCAIVLGLMLVSSLGAAEMQRGMFRLHLTSTFIELGTGETSIDNNPDDQYGGLEIGVGMSRFGIGFAGTLGSGFVVGGKVALGQESGDWHPGSEDDHFLWSVVPYMEYVFLTTRVRPFVKAMLGFEGAHYNNDGGFWGAVLGGGGGIHIFLRDSVSLDVDLDLTFRAGTGHWDAGQNNPDIDFNHWRFSFGTLVGISAWL